MNKKIDKKTINSTLDHYKIEVINEDYNITKIEILKEKLFSILFDYFFDFENLFYYCTQDYFAMDRESAKNYVRKLIEKGTIIAKLDDLFNSLGWDKDNLNIDKTITHGDIGEYLMSIIIDEIFDDIKNIICKVSLKTSKNMPAFSNDNLFFNHKDKILYFGESKFYNDTKKALNDAIKSINKHKFDELSYITTKTNTMKAENEEKRQEIIEYITDLKRDEVIVKNVIFIISDDFHKDKDLKEVINKLNENKKKILEDLILVILPIFSKEDFLNGLKEKIKNGFENL